MRQVNSYNWPPVQPSLGFIYEYKNKNEKDASGGQSHPGGGKFNLGCGHGVSNCVSAENLKK